MWRWPRGPLTVAVTLEPSDEVKALRARVEALEEEAARLKAEYNRVEYKYRCEVIINCELVDLCRAHGVKYRPALSQRPY